MNSKYERLFINFLSVLTLVVFLIHCIIFLIVSGGGLAALIIGKNPNFPYISYIVTTSQGHLPSTFISFFMVLGVLVCRAIIIFAIYKMLRRLYNNHIFDDFNLKYIRWCSVSFSGLVLCDGVLALIWHFIHREVAVSKGQSLGIEILAWFTIYVIYIVFKKGRLLQKENEDFV